MTTLKLKKETTSARLAQIRETRGAPPPCDDWREEARGVVRNLAKIYPAVFNPRDRKPLALDIHEELIRETNYPSVTIRDALRWWTGHGAYLEAVAKGGSRYDLKGAPVSGIKEGHRKHAAWKLKEQKARRISKQQAAKPKRQKPKPPVATQHRLNQLADKFNGGRHAA